MRLGHFNVRYQALGEFPGQTLAGSFAACRRKVRVLQSPTPHGVSDRPAILDLAPTVPGTGVFCCREASGRARVAFPPGYKPFATTSARQTSTRCWWTSDVPDTTSHRCENIALWWLLLDAIGIGGNKPAPDGSIPLVTSTT